MRIGIKKGIASGGSVGAAYFVFFASYSLTFWYGGKLYKQGVSITVAYHQLKHTINVFTKSVTGGDVLVVVMAVMIASFVLGMAASSAEILVSTDCFIVTAYHFINIYPRLIGEGSRFSSSILSRCRPCSYYR